MTIDQETIENLIQKLLHIVEDVVDTEEKYQGDLDLVHPEYKKSARNLIHYLAVRQHDMRDINLTLGMLGVSKMINAEANVMPVLRSVLRILYKFAEGKKLKIKDKSKKFIDAIESFDKNTEDLLGPVRDDRHTRIMVTLPTEAANNYNLVVRLIKSGANSLRINCAHDDENVADQDEQVRKADPALLLLLVAGDVLGPPSVPHPVLDDQPEEDALAEEQPEADEHPDQQDQVVDAAGVGRNGLEVTVDHLTPPTRARRRRRRR